MVATRGHPKDFLEADAASTKNPSSRPRKSGWTHTPSTLTLIWLYISLPLVIWDTGYVFLRPHSMHGGALHWPLWVPYELYGRIDYIYGWKAFHERNGFPAAQSSLNCVETFCYLYYLYLLFAHARPASRSVQGPIAGVAVLVAFSAALMTLSKTMLYWLNEYFSGFGNVGHNNLQDLLLMWIFPNGAWLILPSYMVYVCGSEILQGLKIAAGEATPSSNDTSSLKTE